MITHVVMWKVAGNDPAERKASAENVRQALESLPARVPVIRHLEVGLDESRTPASFDLVLLTRFDSWDDLETYRAHPEHLAVGDVVKAHTTDRVVVDYPGA